MEAAKVVLACILHKDAIAISHRVRSKHSSLYFLQTSFAHTLVEVRPISLPLPDILPHLIFPASAIMAFLHWIQRCTPGVSTLAIIFLLGGFNSRFFTGERQEMTNDTRLGRDRITFSEGFFILYTVFLHIVITTVPLRIFRGARLATQEIQAALKASQLESDQPGSLQSSSHQSIPSELIHVSIIPSYKESIETLQDTLRVLASHRMARNTYDVRWQRTPPGFSFLESL